MTTLEALVTHYRRAVPDSENIELENRFQNVDFAVFESVYKALLKDKSAPGVVTTAVNSIVQTKSQQTADVRKSQYRRQISFVDGVKEKNDKYIIKTALIAPHRVNNPYALSYSVALSSEIPTTEFTSDQGSIVRVIARVEFQKRIPSTEDAKITNVWNIALSVVRQLTAEDAKNALSAIVTRMFKGAKLTDANMLQVLGVSDPALRNLYKFEIEEEFVGVVAGDAKTPSVAPARDSLRPADVTAAADIILELANPNYLRDAAFQAEVFFVAKHIIQEDGLLRRFEHELPLKRLLPQVLAITRGEYAAIYPPVGYWCTDKADGLRAPVVVRDGRASVLAGTELHEFTAPVAVMEKAEKKARLTATTIGDAEFVPDEKGGFTLYLFDVICVEGENVSSDGIEKRIAFMPKVAGILAEFKIKCVPKTYVHITDTDPRTLETQFRSLREAKRPYVIDGIILNKPGDPYWNTISYKWKDIADNTIDFLARLCPPKLLGRAPFIEEKGHKLHFLFVGINQNMFDRMGLQWCEGYSDLFTAQSRENTRDRFLERNDSRAMPAQSGNYFPIQFAPSDAPLAFLYQHPVDTKIDGKPVKNVDTMVVELRCPGACAAAGGSGEPVGWELVKVREDRARDLLSKRYYGNDYKTAELIWNNYIDPFEFRYLWEPPQLGYFTTKKGESFVAQTAVISFVKSQSIQTLRNENVVLDLAFGRGADLGRYMQAGVKTLFGVDVDRAALAEAVRRKYTTKKHAQDSPGIRNRRGTTLHIIVADLLKPYGETLTLLRGAGFQAADAVVMNLAVHYMLASTESMKNFVVLCRDAVKLGGQVIITCMLGHRVHELLKEEKISENKSWDVREGTALKYSIKRLYAGNTLQAAGQKIGVLLPFSGGEYYEEYLVNIEVLTKEFAARGFRHTSTILVQKKLDEFRTHNPSEFRKLTDADKRYLSLFGVLTLKKEKEN